MVKKCYWTFELEEEGSYHESKAPPPKKKATTAAKKYLKSSDGRYAKRDTLEVNKHCD